MKNHEYWLQEAIKLAVSNVENGEGPFAAIVVKDDVIVGTGVNLVNQTSDPTAHAELLAIQQACTSLATTDLSDCVLYASGEPCPMCMGAVYWARPRAVYYACGKHEALEAVQFTDPLANFYQEMVNNPNHPREIPLHKIDCEHRLEPFFTWQRTNS